MNTFVYILISVVVAATIGGVTNYLAIKMLFHPRRPLKIGMRTLPFTPGLIPKRKDEIAQSLGEIVGEYLVTSAGLSQVLGAAHFQQSLVDKLQAALRVLAQSEESVEQWILQRMDEARWNELKQAFTQKLDELTQEGMTWLWEEKNWKNKTCAELLLNWDEDQKEQLVQKATDMIVEALIKELTSLNGDRLIRQLASQFLDQSGGFLGALAGMFMDEEKISKKIRSVMIQRLDTPMVRHQIDRILLRKVAEWESLTLDELIVAWTGTSGFVWLEQQARERLTYEKWLEQLLQWNWKRLFAGGRYEAISERIPWMVERGMSIVSTYLERIIQAIDLPKLVKDQVSDFPVERLEEVVLSVSGREFRAITWLGAVLGGMIGLMQSIFFLMTGGGM